MRYILILLFPIISFSSEGDAFSARLYNYSDMNAKLSQEVDRRLNIALTRANKRSHKCEPEVAIKAIEKEFLRPVVGIFETWASFSDKVQGHHIRYSDSIYKNLSLTENLPVHLGKLGMATFFEINGILVASDKFGHFFDEGHAYFRMIHNEGKTMANALQYGIDLENGSYGLKRSKVFSYGDLVANRNGYEFWNSLFNDKKQNNYIYCTKGVFKQVRHFSFAEYVDNGWDESVNCNSYPADVEKRVNQVISELEAKSGKKLSCLSHKDKCAAIHAKYLVEGKWLINPLCL